MSLTEKMFILSGTLWLTVIAFIIYVWVLHTKQQLVWRYIAQKLAEIEKKMKQAAEQENKLPETSVKPEIKKTETVVTISKSEPMFKYETVNLPDEAEIKFVD